MSHEHGPEARSSADILFWRSLALSLAIAFVAAYPVNRWLVARGFGHAIVRRGHM